MNYLGLNQKSREILKAAQLQADAPFKALRKASGHRDHAITYHLSQLVSRGIARRRCFINLNLLGLQYHEICVALAAGPKNTRAAFIERLVKSPKVVWLGRLGGDYHYAFTVATRSTAELSEFLFDLFAKFSGFFFEKAVALRIAMHFFGNKYLSPKPGLREALSYTPAQTVLEIDDLDRRLLRYLAETGETSAPAIGRALSIPASTVSYRINHLSQRGVIVGYYYEVNAAKLKQQSLLLLISTKGFSLEFTKSLYRFCADSARITTLIQSLGAWDFEIGLDIDEPKYITALLDEIYDRFGAHINWIKVLPMFEHLKVLEYAV